MNNIREVVNEFLKLKNKAKEIEAQMESLKPSIKSYYVESGISLGEDLLVQVVEDKKVKDIYVNLENALRETFDLKKARANFTQEVLNQVEGLVKKTQYSILKVDNKPIAKKLEVA